jgi:quercetin dioxygenase-like cupin family protein
MLHFGMVKNSSRRNFLRSAPLVAAAAVVPATGKVMFAQAAERQPFELFTSEKLSDAMKKLQGAPGNENLYAPQALPFTVVMTTEEKKAAKEFEWHEGRDHILQVLDGTTLYEVGGKPKGGHNTKPGEWLAPASEGSTTYTLHKGDMLIIPRNTPHKRSTEGSVTFILISTTGQAT